MDDFIKAITYNYPEHIPVSVGFLPRAWLVLGDELVRFANEYKDLIPYSPKSTEEVYKYLSPRYRAGEWVDEWGCLWSNEVDGMDAIVTGHPIKNREDIRTLDIPSNDDGNIPHGFLYLRYLDLRGFEEAMYDFGEECEECDILLEKITLHTMKQIDIFAGMSHNSIIYLGDDLGMQTGLLLGPDKWRRYIKPYMKRIYDRAKRYYKYVYMHTDGMIYEIMPDLHEIGADVINPQFRANGLENLVRVCKGKIPINLDLDRQLFPFATPSQLDDHVREAIEAMYLPQGGLSINIEMNYDIPFTNMAAILDAVRKYR